MAPAEIEHLLESPTHAVRVGAVSVMDFQARSRKTTPERRRELFELYLRRHDRIDTWDLVDRSAIWVVGEYLVDKPRDVLYELAASDRPMERRTAILARSPSSAGRARRRVPDRRAARRRPGGHRAQGSRLDAA